MKPKDLSFFINKFFTGYLTTQRNVSGNTIKAYRDTFLLLFSFMSKKLDIRIEKLSVQNINREVVTDFLEWLEKDRENSIATRNQRLAAIHAFFKFLQSEDIEYMLQCNQILSIPMKKKAKPLVHYLEENELKLLLQAVDAKTSGGRRDLALLSLLYDTGARVQEIIDLTLDDIRFEKPSVVKLTGKGRKSRVVPLMKNTADLLKSYIDETAISKNGNQSVFQNNQGDKLTRNGVAYVLNKYAKKAFSNNAMLRFNITPHVLRHTKAMHLLRADVNMFYIRDLLGHTEVSTTEVYARVDAEKKRAVLEKISDLAIPRVAPKWQEDAILVNWLKNLGK